VVHGKEPSHFLAMFGGRLVIFAGGKAGWGSSQLQQDEGPGDTYLLHVRGTAAYNTKAEQVRQTDTHRQRDTHRQTHTDRQTDRHTQTERHAEADHTRTHARTLARTHARTHTHTQPHSDHSVIFLEQSEAPTGKINMSNSHIAITNAEESTTQRQF